MNTKNIIALIMICFILIPMLSCDRDGGEMEEKTTEFPSMKDVPTFSWEKLSQRKFFSAISR